MNERLIQHLQKMRQLAGGFRASRVVLTANNYGIFEHLKKPKTSAALAGKLKIDPRATEILLDAVTALGLLKKKGSVYRNSALATTFLIKKSLWYQGDMLRHSDHLWKNWTGLDEIVRAGRPSRLEGRDYQIFIKAMHNNAILLAPMVIDAIDTMGVKTALDLGGGPGTYCTELSRRGVRATLFDLPEAVEIARKLVKRKTVRFMSGDFHSDDIGSGYDLLLISQIVHSLSIKEIQALLKKARNALNPSGKIAIHEFLLNNDRAHPVTGALFSINMLINTAKGRCYTPKEMTTWLKKTGFKSIKTKKLGDTVVLTGRKG
jgi:2-polyprenyl-3-methyl-5-hydroxy-6-metoxy-1,4-benzoquinol methylase